MCLSCRLACLYYSVKWVIFCFDIGVDQPAIDSLGPVISLVVSDPLRSTHTADMLMILTMLCSHSLNSICIKTGFVVVIAMPCVLCWWYSCRYIKANLACPVAIPL